MGDAPRRGEDLMPRAGGRDQCWIWEGMTVVEPLALTALSSWCQPLHTGKGNQCPEGHHCHFLHWVSGTRSHSCHPAHIFSLHYVSHLHPPYATTLPYPLPYPFIILWSSMPFLSSSYSSSSSWQLLYACSIPVLTDGTQYLILEGVYSHCSVQNHHMWVISPNVNVGGAR